MSVETLPLEPQPSPVRLRREALRDRLVDGGLPISRGWALAGVGALMALSLALRLRNLHAFYWVDEGLSVGIASHPLRQIPSLLRQDGSPPLYYLLLHLWMSLRGRGEAATHQLSLLFSLLSIPTAYWAGSSLGDRRTGLTCAFLAALVPFLSVYGEETRMYSLVALESIVVAAAFVHAFLLRRRRHLALFAVALAAVLYTHNWGLFLALACLATVAWLALRAPAEERRPLLRDAALGFGGVALLFAAWLPTLVYQARHTGAPWDLPPVLWSLTQGAYSIVGGRGAAVAILLAAGSGLLALGAAGAPGRRLALMAVTLLALGVGTLLLAWAYSKLSPAWAFRYLAVIVGPLLLATGIGLRRAGRLGVVAVVLLAGFWILDPVPHSRDFKSNVGAVAARVRSQLDRGSLVIATQPEQVPTLAYYLPGVRRFGTPLGPVPDPGVVDWRGALERLRRGSVRSTLMPMVAALPVGERLLLLNTTNLKKTPEWMKLIRRDSSHWLDALRHDRSLRLLGTVATGWQYAGVAVRGYLFVKRA